MWAVYSSAQLYCFPWAASRKVTREEDMAYSLMGIFGVSISTAYGEGADRAFRRLLEEIMRSTSEGVFDLFNWAGKGAQRHTSLLPSSPKQYRRRSTKLSINNVISPEPLMLTPRGIRIPVVLMPALSIDAQNSQQIFFGDYGATVNVSFLDQSSPESTTYCLLHKDVSGPDERWGRPRSQLTFAVFNIQHLRYTASETRAIKLPQTCIAVVLECQEEAGKVTDAGRHSVVLTTEPVVFELESKKSSRFNIPLEHLAKHRMQLVHMYL